MGWGIGVVVLVPLKMLVSRRQDGFKFDQRVLEQNGAVARHLSLFRVPTGLTLRGSTTGG